MIHVPQPTRTTHLAPVLVLIVLAPTIAEILLGNLLLTASVIPTLLLDILLYGSGAILVREIVRRLHRGWPSILLLAAAYGLVEEGLILQTVFNPHFPGLGMVAAYGRVLGVSWFWLIGVVAMHAVWSITVPILLTERLFPALADVPWLGRLGLGLDALIYVLISLVMIRFFSVFTRFSAPPVTLLVTAFGVVVLIWLALSMVPHQWSGPRKRTVPTPFWVGVMALLVGGIFFGIQQVFLLGALIPAVLPMLVYGGLYGMVGSLIGRWSAAPAWTAQHQLALATGALLTYMLYGVRLAARGSRADLIVHGVVCAIIAGLLIGMFTRLARPPSQVNPLNQLRAGEEPGDPRRAVNVLPTSPHTP